MLEREYDMNDENNQDRLCVENWLIQSLFCSEIENDKF